MDTTHEQEFKQADKNPPAPAAFRTGYKIVGDNIDKNIRHSYQWIDRTRSQSTLFPYVHCQGLS